MPADVTRVRPLRGARGFLLLAMVGGAGPSASSRLSRGPRPRSLPPRGLPSLQADYPLPPLPEGFVAQRELHHRRPPRPRGAHHRRAARPRVAQPQPTGPSTPSRSTSTGTPSATTSRPRPGKEAVARLGPAAERDPRELRLPARARTVRLLGDGHESRPHADACATSSPTTTTPTTGRSWRSDARGRWPRARPSRFAHRVDVAHPLRRPWAAPAGCTTTTSSCSGSPRSACSGRASSWPTSSTPRPSSSPTTATTT